MTWRFERKSLTLVPSPQGREDLEIDWEIGAYSLSLVPSPGERDDLEIDWETDAKDRYSKRQLIK